MDESRWSRPSAFSDDTPSGPNCDVHRRYLGNAVPANVCAANRRRERVLSGARLGDARMEPCRSSSNRMPPWPTTAGFNLVLVIT
jgi:hypothetical protein